MTAYNRLRLESKRDFIGQPPPPKQRHFPIQAFCPMTGSLRTFYLTEDLVLGVLKFRPRSSYYAVVGDRTDPSSGSPVQQVLLAPTAVFSGVREHQEGGLCYCGTPTCAYTNDGAKIPPVPGKVFLVYVNPRGHLFEWRWDQEDPEFPGYPIGWDDKSRFREQLWPTQ
jgi:hypothetical protein